MERVKGSLPNPRRGSVRGATVFDGEGGGIFALRRPRPYRRRVRIHCGEDLNAARRYKRARPAPSPRVYPNAPVWVHSPAGVYPTAPVWVHNAAARAVEWPRGAL